jgi:adenine-specific DNA-methyltransferase
MVKTNYSDWNKNDLIKEIQKFKKRKKYGVVWDEEKTKEIFEIESKNKCPILKEDGVKEIHSEGTYPYNVIIEGDNYHSLSVLNYTHKNKIDLIYIDPPYNTGNSTFKYNDKIIDDLDSYRHSKWLSFMKKRLELAKKLLKKSGVIFISIDDNEFAQLKLLCSEIFDERNFVANIIWQKKFSPQNDARYFSDMHDFILVYAKKKNSGGEKSGWKRNLIPRSEEMDARYKNPDNDPRGNWMSSDLSVKTYSFDYDYPITNPNGRRINPPKGRCWMTSRKKVEKMIADNRIWFGKTGNNTPRLKRFLSEVQDGLVPTTIWDRKFAGDNQDAKHEIKTIFEDVDIPFQTPKPKKLIKKIIQIASNKKDIVVLDFFAGSGTTGHAVLELNKEDGGNRKFILCTNNEGSIATKVCYPRIKKIINGFSSNGVKIDGIGGNLKYFKTSFVDYTTTDKNKKFLVAQSTEMLCLNEDCFDHVKFGENYKIFKNKKEHYLGIIYDDAGIEPFRSQILKLKKKINTYIFSLDESAREEEFEDIHDLVNLKPIPEVIRNVYRRIFR